MSPFVRASLASRAVLSRRGVSTFPPYPTRVPARSTRPVSLSNNMQPPPPLPPTVNAAKQEENEAAKPPAAHRVIFQVSLVDFEELVVGSPVPVVMACWAPWSKPSVQIGPVLERLVQAHGGRVRLARLNTEKHADIAGQLQIKSLPMLYTVHAGRVVDQAVGFKSEAELKEYVDSAAAYNPQADDDNKTE